MERQPNNARVYLCGPIHGCSDAQVHDWRDEMAMLFPNSVDPTRRDYRGYPLDRMREVVELDKRDIRNSDVVVCKWDAERVSVGSAMEIIYAWTIGIPVVLWCLQDVQFWLAYHSTMVTTSWDETVAAVRKICT